MKYLNEYISEKLSVSKSMKTDYSCQPKTRDELKSLVKNRLAKDKNYDLNDIDVSKIDDMSYLFDGLDPHNIDISQWDVSNVKNMKYMFYNCKNFNCDLSSWDVSSVKDMSFMFASCKSFNSDLSQWDVSNAKNLGYMFVNCSSLDSDFSQWVVSAYTHWAFNGCNSMKDIPNWYK